MQLFNNIYKGKKVMLTGHTGFKGSWLAFWLEKMGADVMGYSIDVPTVPSHFQLLNTNLWSVQADIINQDSLFKAFREFQPVIVFHMAAQALVRPSYQNPVKTFETNVIGTANVFEACKITSSVRAIVNVTSDKCYENREIDYAYKENDPMGGFDPYSASKGCAELVANSFRNSFFNLKDYGTKHNILLASVRAGNVIGGGDWATDRLIPDMVKATVSKKSIQIRSPNAIRPWQHVLEPLSGYLLVGQKLLEEKKEFAQGWNFGPLNNEAKKVSDVMKLMKKEWDDMEFEINSSNNNSHEANLLQLDCSKANELLQWTPVWDTEMAVRKTAQWFKNFYFNNQVNTASDLEDYISAAASKKMIWAN